MKRFLQSWFINTLAVLLAVLIVPSIRYEHWLHVFVASLLLGIFNAVLRPFLMFLALPLLIVTLGLFTLIINAGLLYLVGIILRPYFVVESFWAAFLGGLIISFASLVLNTLTGTGNSRVKFETRRRPPSGGSGPVIDV